MKPNTAELCALMNNCLTMDKLPISNRSQVTKILSKYSTTSPLASTSDVHELISDMRILGSGLLGIMNSKSNRSSQEMRRKNRCVVGKHVLISMGKHGILWIGPSSVIGADADVHITDHISSKHLISNTLIPQKDIINTSGAGDSFCAGLIHHLLSSKGGGGVAANGESSQSMKKAIIAGMTFAEKSLTSLSAIGK
jgi:sugar/nucleoside kinase (ribokinase family)